jgi:hypothetical protein
LAEQQAISRVFRVQKRIKEAKNVEKINIRRCLYTPPPPLEKLVWWPDNRFSVELTDVSLRKRDHERPRKEYQENLEKRQHVASMESYQRSGPKHLGLNLGIDPPCRPTRPIIMINMCLSLRTQCGLSF